uniref:Uncharacterized protein n=1 Tax=Trichogramma kaykai TaxID=54128 RepID=A0ABD2WY51_9HYME
MGSFEFLQGDGRDQLSRPSRQLQGGPARHSRKQSRHRAAHQERGARLPGLRASQARHGNPVWPTPCVGVDFVAKLSPAPSLAGLDRRAQQERRRSAISAVHQYTGSQRRRGFALVMEASHAPVMTSMRLDAISSAVPGATEAPDTTAEKRSASSVRAFHLQV